MISFGKLMNARLILPTFLFFLLSSQTVVPEDTAWVTNEKAVKASELVKVGGIIRFFCKHCGDKTYKEIKVLSKKIIKRNYNLFQLVINDKIEIDLAYIYIFHKEQWQNLAMLAGISDLLNSPKFPPARYPESINKKEILTKLHIEDIDYYEYLEPQDYRLIYIRSIIESHSITYGEFSEQSDLDEKEKNKTNKLVTFLNGIYRQKDDKYYPLWERVGTEDDGYGNCAIESEYSCMGGCIDDFRIETYYENYLNKKNKQFCIKNAWSPYRFTNNTLFCFDLETPEKPILDLLTSYIREIRVKEDKSLEIEATCMGRSMAGPDSCINCYQYYDTSKSYEETTCKRLTDFVSYNEEGEKYYREKKYNKALDKFLKAYELDNNDQKVLGNIGITYIKLGDYKNSITYSKKALFEVPREYKSFDNFYFNLGLAYEKLGRYLEAIYWYKQIENKSTNTKEKIDELFSKIDKKMSTNKLPVLYMDKSYSFPISDREIIFKIPKKNINIMLSFFERYNDPGTPDGLIILYKKGNNFEIDVINTQINIEPESNIDFFIDDYNEDMYPDILAQFILTIDGKKRRVGYYWAFNGNTNKYKDYDYYDVDFFWALKNPEQIDALDFTENFQKQIPNHIDKFINLKKLILDKSKFKTLPTELISLKNIEEFSWTEGSLENFPNELTKLFNLKILNLRNNKLTILPPEIGQLKNLERLYLSGNKLTNIPAEIKNLKKLKRLELDSNQLIALPDEFGELLNLEEIYLGGNHIEHISNKIANLSNLKILYLNHNRLVILPSEIKNLITLGQLDLSNNQIEIFPSEIQQISSLGLLDLGNNKLKIVPKGIANLEKLKSLILDNNQIEQIPFEIGKLINLGYLDLENNKLRELPSSLANLKKLEMLKISKNEFSQLEKDKIKHMFFNTKVVIEF